MRRMAHYDYWSDKVKRSILMDSGADLLSYGMGEHSICSSGRGVGQRTGGGRHCIYTGNGVQVQDGEGVLLRTDLASFL